MRYIVLVLFAIMCAGEPAIAASAAERATPIPILASKVDSLARRFEQEDRFSGVLIIAHDGKPLFVHAYGFADREKRIRIEPETSFYLASVGKMFTAVAVLQLVSSGHLSLDDTVGKILPDYPNHEIATKVTVRQLLTHSGGTGDIPIFSKDDAENRQSLRTVADYVQKLGSRPPEFEPGSKQSYSNYGFIILGQMIERVSGQSYYDYVRDHIFQPADMKHSGFPLRDEPAPSVATGYTAADWDLSSATTLRPNIGTLPWRGSPAGGGVASAPDLLRFLNAFEAGKLVPVALFQQAITPQVPGESLGFWLDGEGKTFRWAHGGGAWGMNADVRVYPNTGYTIICLANRDPQVADRIADYFEMNLAGGERDAPLFLRGTMNDWSTATPLKRVTADLYRTELTLKAGTYEFKLASADWKTVDLGDGGFGPTIIHLGRAPAPLSSRGANLQLSIPQNGMYAFELSGLANGDPQVTVSPIAK